MSKKEIKIGLSYDDSTNDEPIRDSLEKVISNTNQVFESDNRNGAVSFNRPSGSFIGRPDAPVTGNIPILIIDDGTNLINGENNDSKEGNVALVWVNANTLGVSGFNGQFLTRGTFPANEVCLVSLIYNKLNNIIVADVGSFNSPYVLNTKPIISLIGASNVNTQIGLPYADAGATAVDVEDGDITADIVTVNNVNISALGTYQVTFNVDDSGGNPAVEVIRIVNVVSNAGASATSPIISVGNPVSATAPVIDIV